MAGEVRRASDCGPARCAAHPEMVEGRRAGGVRNDTQWRQGRPGWKCIAASGERLSSLRIRSVGSSVAQKCAHGDVIVVRYADDIVVGFKFKEDADRFWAELPNRMRSSNWSCTRRRRGLWSSVGMRSTTGSGWRGQTGNVRLSWLHAYLWEDEEQGSVHGASADDSQKHADEVDRGESRASTTHARTYPRTGQVVASGGAWTHPVLRSAPEPQRAVDLSVPSGAALVSRAFRDAARTAASFGIACGASSLAGCLCLPSVIPIPCAAWASLPKARAGCGNTACPDPWEGVVCKHDRLRLSSEGSSIAFYAPWARGASFEIPIACRTSLRE